MKNYTLFNADCLEAMKQMPDNSIDAIVTDPPYGLNFMGKDFDNPKMMGQSAFLHGGLKNYPQGVKRTGYADCDMVKFQNYMTPIFAEALRVSKPGAHLLAFGGSRTFHRMACAIEDAGWEIRDCIMWVYGSGFPKSMDVSKAIDKKLGAERTEVLGHKNQSDMRGGALMETQGKPRLNIPITAPASEEAKKWNGYGTCLKPAFEPIIVARKPLDGTVADNVLKWGTGAINIDGCRVPYEKGGSAATNPLVRELHGCKNNHGPDTGASWCITKEGKVGHANLTGRFPANLVHDGSDEVLACFPDSKGALAPVYGKQSKGQKSRTGDNGIYGHYEARDVPMFPRGDSGSAARFFYCAKASRSERGEGNGHPTVKPIALMEYLVKLIAPPNAVVLDPFMGSGTTGVATRKLGRNFVGIEMDASYYEIAKKRIGEVQESTIKQDELFD